MAANSTRACGRLRWASKKIPRQGRLCRPRRGNGIEARFWRDGLSPFGPARRLDGAPKRNRSGGAQARRRGDLCQRWWRRGPHRKRRNRGAAVCARALDRRRRAHARSPSYTIQNLDDWIARVLTSRSWLVWSKSQLAGPSLIAGILEASQCKC